MKLSSITLSLNNELINPHIAQLYSLNSCTLKALLLIRKGGNGKSLSYAAYWHYNNFT